MTRMHGAGRVVVRLLCIAGLLALGYVTYAVLDGKVYEPIEHSATREGEPECRCARGRSSAEGAFPANRETSCWRAIGTCSSDH